MSGCVLGIDVSTTAVKAVVWDFQGRMVGQGRRPLTLLPTPPGWAEQNPGEWWSALCGAVRDAVADISPSTLAGVCLAHQRETFVLVDESGQPVYPAILWLDERGAGQLEWLRRQYGEETLHRINGKPLDITASLSKIAWMRAHRPDQYRQARYVLDVHAFLVQKMTGEPVTSWANADPTGLLDMEARQWSETVLEPLGLSVRQLPRLVPPGTETGRLTPDAAREMGVPSRLPVIAGAGDGQSAGLGVNVTSPGRAYLNLGTAVVSGIFSEDYRTDRSFRTMQGCIPGTYILETLIRSGTHLITWFKDRLASAYADRVQGSLERHFEEQAAGLPPGADGLILLPYWSGASTPFWDNAARGLIVGWRAHHGLPHIYRSILEGIALEQRLQTDAVERVTGQPVTRYAVMGGGAQSPLWLQIIADVTGKPVVMSETPEATCLGAGILAAYGCGAYSDVKAAAAAMTSERDTVTPRPEIAAYYQELYHDVYARLFETVQPLMKRLTALSDKSTGFSEGEVSVL